MRASVLIDILSQLRAKYYRTQDDPAVRIVGAKGGEQEIKQVTVSTRSDEAIIITGEDL